MNLHPNGSKIHKIDSMQLLSHIYSHYFSVYYNIKMLD